MKKIVKVMCLAALMVSMSFGANAQMRQSIYLNLNAPTGDWSKQVEGNYSLPLTYTGIGKDASAGFGLGYRVSYRFDVGVGLVAPFAQADFFWNTISGDLSDDYTQARAKATPTYFNIPIQLGITYFYDELWSNITPYAEFGLGTDLMMITAEGPFTIAGIDYGKYSYKTNAAFAFSLGVGAFFGEHVSAGLYYYGMGKHTIEYTSSTYNGLTPVDQQLYDKGDVETRTVGSLALRIGFHF